MKVITLDEYLMGREKLYPLTDEMLKDAIEMVHRANLLLGTFGRYRRVNSGYRPAAINATIPGAAVKSNHIICRAVDLDDWDGMLDAFCLKNEPLLEQIGLWMELATPRWTHLQSVPPLSKRRYF